MRSLIEKSESSSGSTRYILFGLLISDDIFATIRVGPIPTMPLIQRLPEFFSVNVVQVPLLHPNHHQHSPLRQDTKPSMLACSNLSEEVRSNFQGLGEEAIEYSERVP